MVRPVTRRRYDQFCGVARALDVVGERWTLLLVRNLLLGPRRYSDLLAESPGLTTNLLAKRLAELERAGLVERRVLPPPNPATVYALTPAGQELEPVVLALGAFGSRSLDAPKPRDTVNLAWGFFSLKRRYRGGLTGAVAFEVEGRRYTLRFEPSRLLVSDADRNPVDATVTGTSAAVRDAVLRGERRARAALRVEGDRPLAERALDALALPG